MREAQPGGKGGSTDQVWGIAGELLSPVSASGLHPENQWTYRRGGVGIDGVGVRGVGVVGDEVKTLSAQGTSLLVTPSTSCIHWQPGSHSIIQPPTMADEIIGDGAAAQAHNADIEYFVRRGMTKGYQVASLLTPLMYTVFATTRYGRSHINVNRLLRAIWMGGSLGTFPLSGLFAPC